MPQKVKFRKPQWGRSEERGGPSNKKKLLENFKKTLGGEKAKEQI